MQAAFLPAWELPHVVASFGRTTQFEDEDDWDGILSETDWSRQASLPLDETREVAISLRRRETDLECERDCRRRRRRRRNREGRDREACSRY